jgi:hypothetical protein
MHLSDVAGELHTFMMNQFHEGRGFVMGLRIVAMLIVDMVVLLKNTLF